MVIRFQLRMLLLNSLFLDLPQVFKETTGRTQFIPFGSKFNPSPAEGRHFVCSGVWGKMETFPAKML